MNEESNKFVPGKPPKIVTVVPTEKSSNISSSHHKLLSNSPNRSIGNDNLRNNYINKIKMSPCCSLIKKTIDTDLDELEEYGIPSSPAKNLIRSSSLYVYFGDEPEVSPIHTKDSTSLKFRKESKSTPAIFNDPQFKITLSPIRSMSEKFIKVKDIQKLMKAQAIIRRWLVIHKYRKIEEKRVVDRIAYESIVTENYNREVERITKLINEDKRCEELDQAKQLIDDYSNIILNNDVFYYYC